MARHNARNTDPDTSHRAAAANRRGRATHQQRMLEAYARADERGLFLTDQEAAERAGLLQPGVCWWHRASDLRYRGLIEWKRHADGTRCVEPGPNGISVGVSVITDAGRNALRGAA